MQYPSYTIAIRTLGKSGEAFKKLIHSLEAQSVQPSSINIYIAKGYKHPEQIGKERYFEAPKGIATQRVIDLSDIETEYILFLDDDLELAADSVKRLFDGLFSMNGDCISPNIFPNHTRPTKEKLLQAMFHATLPSFRHRFAFTIRPSSYYSYNNRPREVMESQSCAGACLLMKTDVYKKMHYYDETWLDTVNYSIGEDQVFAYKMYRLGYKLLVHYNIDIIHLDAQTSHTRNAIKADFDKNFIRYIIWYRTIWQPDGHCRRIKDCACFYLVWGWHFILSFIPMIKGKGNTKTKNAVQALKAAKNYVRSEQFKSIPVWNVTR